MICRTCMTFAAAALLSVGAVAFLRTSSTNVTAQTPTETPSTQPSAKPVNTICPITKEPIDAKGKTVVYKGKTIGFCCGGCEKDFNKDPEKYMKDLK